MLGYGQDTPETGKSSSRIPLRTASSSATTSSVSPRPVLRRCAVIAATSPPTVPAGNYRIEAASNGGGATIRGLVDNDGAPWAIQALSNTGNVRVSAG